MKQLPLKHISIRVPWHDSAWNGTVCKCPKADHACVMLDGIRKDRDEDWEEERSGKHFQ